MKIPPRILYLHFPGEVLVIIARRLLRSARGVERQNVGGHFCFVLFAVMVLRHLPDITLRITTQLP